MDVEARVAPEDDLPSREHSERDVRDAAILSANADALNAEALESFEFVNDLFEAHGIERP